MGTMFGASWKTSLFGILGGVAMALGTALQTGTIFPTTGQGWMSYLMALLLAGLGLTAKDRDVTNAPKPAEAAMVVEDKAESASAVPTRKIAP